MSILQFGPFRAAWREVFLSPGLDKLDPGLLEFGPKGQIGILPSLSALDFQLITNIVRRQNLFYDTIHIQ